jgi:hypothetical protein
MAVPSTRVLRGAVVGVRVVFAAALAPVMHLLCDRAARMHSRQSVLLLAAPTARLSLS